MGANGYVFFLMIRRPPRSTLDRSSAASDVYKRQTLERPDREGRCRRQDDAESAVPDVQRVSGTDPGPRRREVHLLSRARFVTLTPASLHGSRGFFSGTRVRGYAGTLVHGYGGYVG